MDLACCSVAFKPVRRASRGWEGSLSFRLTNLLCTSRVSGMAKEIPDVYKTINFPYTKSVSLLRFAKTSHNITRVDHHAI